MSGFSTHTGTLAVLPGDHVDTDRIIPARFLSKVSKAGYGELAFADVRGGDFALDQPEALGASILVVGTNFGCGSSREHAVWAIQQAGFSVIIARTTSETAGYSDIFRQNAANCGLLLLELDESSHAKFVAAGSGATATVDLESCRIELGSETIPFRVLEATRLQIIRGLDLIGTTLEHGAAIDAFEKNMVTFVPAKESLV